ncbi:MAG: ATP-binding protein [Planctomycetota bacterium]|nr:ATP-binding protein [Planctomycetota bacterium]
MRLHSLLTRLVLPFLGIALVVATAVIVAVRTSSPTELLQSLTLCSAAAAFILVVVLVVMKWRNWQRPLDRLEQTAARMADGDWGTRATPQGSEGMRRMAANLNRLAAQAQKQLSDLQQERGGLQALVDTMPDPILAADSQGRIILLNTPAARLLSLRPSQAMHEKLVNVVNDEQIVELYEAIEAGASLSAPGGPAATPLHRELRVARQGQRLTFQAVAIRTPSGGSLLVLRDVSTLAGAVQMKTDFVANASHELRTPIAAIKIAFETLRDVYREDPAQSDRCIAVIDGHLRRLEEMLRDLLDLSRVESADLKPHVSVVKTSELLALLKSTIGSFARQKNVELRLGDQDPTTPIEFATDSRLLNLMLKNLVENSIKFTPSGGKVTVTIRELPPVPGSAAIISGKIVIAVADTGIGIAPEHIDRVFERFYQVDSARSGSAGRGTGLGLAIVKHAAHALGGVVRLESVVGGGTTVTCEFPDHSPMIQSGTQSAVA